ncbi:hypothetical protein [Campylobacter coli]|uniref:hypothetical protein n=1 Tax=Campylobacter coli TaxID=195 RepID=UPI00073EF35C|nr:hypothetical protein [Campylobacter coli]
MIAYIHIGLHKTGTTSLQVFLNRNEKILHNRYNIYCPKSTTMFNRIHHRKLKTILDNYFDYKNRSYFDICNLTLEEYREEVQALKKEVRSNSNSTFVFSDEGFSWWFNKIEKVRLVKNFFFYLGFTKIIPIIYLRETSDFLISLSSQDVKSGRQYFKTNIKANCNHPFIYSYDYRYICLNYAKVFGKENLIVRLFDKNEFYQGDLLKDFIHSIGLEWDDEFIIPPKQNESLDLLGIELQESLYRVKNLGDRCWNFISKHFASKEPQLKFQPPKEIVQSYIDYFEESNEWVRKEFFPHKERLFPKKDLTNYKENYELKEMKPEYWDRIAEFIADIVKTKNQAIQNKDNQIISTNNEKQKLIDEKTNLQTQINQLQNTLNALPIKKQQLEISNLEQDLINKKLQTKQLERQLGLVSNDAVVSHGNKITIIHPNSAKSRIQNQLSYKLGQAMIVNSKSLLGYIRMPFVLSYIYDKHKQEQKIYQEKIKKDPSLKLPPLESYPDYKEALKEKECLTYKLGEALIKVNKTWYKGGYVKLIFEIRKLKKEFKKKANHA